MIYTAYPQKAEMGQIVPAIIISPWTYRLHSTLWRIVCTGFKMNVPRFGDSFYLCFSIFSINYHYLKGGAKSDGFFNLSLKLSFIARFVGWDNPLTFNLFWGGSRYGSSFRRFRLKAGNVSSCGHKLENSTSFFVEMSMLIIRYQIVL